MLAEHVGKVVSRLLLARLLEEREYLDLCHDCFLFDSSVLLKNNPDQEGSVAPEKHGGLRRLA